MERTANDLPAMRYWRAVKDAVARASGDDGAVGPADAIEGGTAETLEDTSPSAGRVSDVREGAAPSPALTDLVAEAPPPVVPENEFEAEYRFQALT